MNNKMIKLILAGMLTLNVMQEPIIADLTDVTNGLDIPDKNSGNIYTQTFKLNENKLIECTYDRGSGYLNINDKLSCFIYPGLATAAALYIGYNYLIRQDVLVSEKYPIAYSWYQAMTEKYPAANLATKQFIQTPTNNYIGKVLSEIAKKSKLISSYHHIYFNKENLKEISYLYKKVMDGYPLTDKEQLAMARQEFMVLHEAGHIENNDTVNIVKTIIGLMVAINGVNFVIDSAASFLAKEDNNSSSQRIINISTNSILPMTTCYLALTSILRNQTSGADSFACTNADTATLAKALSLFEDDETDELFEIEKKQLAAHIKTDSTCGNIIQSVIDPFEYAGFHTVKFIQVLFKSTFVTRWVYDFCTDQVKPGPSIRAQAIKDELARRQA